MRGIAFGLLLANLLLGAWTILLPTPGDSALAPSVSGQDSAVSGISLLFEVPQHSLFPYEITSNPVPILGEEAQPIDASEVNQSDQPQSCVELGPFATRQLADTLIAALDPDLALTVETRFQSPTPLYRVYIAPLENRETAAESLGSLQVALTGKGLVIESFLIPRGELANGIALGLFSEHQNALNVKEQVERLGFPVQIREEGSGQKEERYWIIIQHFDFEDNIERLRDSAAQLAPSAELLEKLCQTIAQDILLP
jgi:hypothetical protein